MHILNSLFLHIITLKSHYCYSFSFTCKNVVIVKFYTCAESLSNRDNNAGPTKLVRTSGEHREHNPKLVLRQ